MKHWIYWLAAASTVAGGATIQENVTEARKLLDSTRYGESRSGRDLLERSVQLCDIALEEGCPDAYIWLGMAIAAVHPGEAVLREQVEPLFAKALERSGSSPSALALELEARALQTLGDRDRAEPLALQAVVLRKAAVEQLSVTYARDPAPAIRVGGGMKPPGLKSRREPEYTQEGRLSRFAGTVQLSAVVGTDGRAHDIKLVRSIGFGLDEKAAEAVRAWIFEPGMKDGRPVNVIANIEVNFRLL
jgi:TonB family protein